jgi:Carboxypeptidase regulatory-like domain
MRTVRWWIVTVLACWLVTAVTPPAQAQTTISTGSIVGVVSDPSGALVSGARITITRKSTGQAISVASNTSGTYNSGALVPGDYTVQIFAKGFRTLSQAVTVLVGNTATTNAKLQVGQENQVVDVQGTGIQVNTEQAGVQGVLNETQIENLPVNGRNFLDLAQLEPGVQIQDGQDFDPTKAGYSSISFGGRFGRTARIEVDGVDVSDETVGTTTTDIPASSIQEFQLSQSSLDLSNELTSSGAVNVTTRSGTNSFHGQAFGLFRDSAIAAKLPSAPGIKSPFQRDQFGGRFGGPIIKNRFFFFLDGERTKQDEFSPQPVSTPFSQYSGGFQSPFRETDVLAKADYQLAKSAHLFYRYTYFQNSLAANAGYAFSVYKNKDITRTHAIGADFNTGSFTHSVRFQYLKFQNNIVDATTGTTLPLANLPLELIMGNTGLDTGPNWLAPQATIQSNKQIKYDGSKSIHSHILRYGISYNRVLGGGFAYFYGLAAQLSTNIGPSELAFAASGPFPGGISNPLNYPVETVVVSNGQGYTTPQPSFGLPAGRLGPDNRIGVYFGDSWKVKPNLTLSYGLRYVRDSGRTDTDIAPISQLNNLIPGIPNLGGQVKQPNLNFAPQFGFAWDPRGQGKTSIRGGIGLFYENAVWNNVLYDAPLREANGVFNITPTACNGSGQSEPILVTGGTLTPGPGVCGPAGGAIAIGSAASAIAAFQKQYQALSPFDLTQANPNNAGAAIAGGFAPSTYAQMFYPDYKSPRSVQMNLGIEREIKPGMVVNIDYVRNVQTHYLLGVDVNHTGDSRYFNKNAALNAIALTNSSFGCPTGVTGVDCAIAAGATMVDYAGNGLTSSSEFGGVCSNPNVLGVPCAFSGINPNAPPLQFLMPIGRSVYSALQAKLVDNVKLSSHYIRSLNLQLAYSLSRFENSGSGPGAGGSTPASPGASDQDFIGQALDQRQANQFFGPSVLDRTHQVSFGAFADLPGGFRASTIFHFYSPLATSLVVPNTNAGFGEIFRTDFTGDGTIQDLIPGTNVGSFMRGTNASNINSVISHYNSVVANQPTPAGQVLIQNGLFNLTQLQHLGGVAPQIPLAPLGQVNLAWLRAFDLKLTWAHTFHELVTVEPSVGLYNLFNFANFDLPGNALNGLLTGAAGQINGTIGPDHNINRVGVGTGVYGLGAPRQLEFGLQFSF